MQEASTAVLGLKATLDADREREAAGNLTTLAANRDTDPGNPGDRFKVAYEDMVNGHFIMSFPSLPTRFYRIESTLALAPPWTDVGLSWF